MKLIFCLTLICTLNLFAEDTVPELGSYEGEFERMDIQQNWIALQADNIAAKMNASLQDHMNFVNQEQSKFKSEVETPPFFEGGTDKHMDNADHINSFAKEMIRDKLDKSKLDELLEIAVETELKLTGGGKEIVVANFGDTRGKMFDHMNASGDIYEELLDLTQIGYEDDVTLREQYKGQIDQSVIPFEKGEIGIGLVDKLVTFQVTDADGNTENFDAFATTFGQAKPGTIEERGVHDIIVDRFASDAAKVMEENRNVLQAAVYDRGELEAEGRKFPRHGGEMKVDQDKAVMETFIKTLKLTQRQTAYEGAFYAKLAKHTTDLAKTDLEDAAIFVSIFYDATSKSGDGEKARNERWKSFVDSLGGDLKKHFEEYLAIHSSAVANPFNHKANGTIEGILAMLKGNKAEFAKQPFIFKQYKDEGGGDPGNIEKQRENAMKFYYEKVLNVLGLNFSFTPEPPMGAKGADKFQAVTDFGKGANIKGVGNWEWETENVDGVDRIQRLKSKSKGYKDHLLYRSERRFDWAKRFYDIANQMRKIASNIQTMMEGTQRYKYDGGSAMYTDELEESSFKSYGGGTFKNMREYYDALSELSEQNVDMSSSPRDLIDKHAIIGEKYWKIDQYKASGTPANARDYKRTRGYQRKTRGGKLPTVRRKGLDPNKRRGKKY